jgi:hypothetical protein
MPESTPMMFVMVNISITIPSSFMTWKVIMPGSRVPIASYLVGNNANVDNVKA